MKIEDVKQWQCGNGLAVAVNPYEEFKSKSSFGSANYSIFNQWASDPANQPVTDLDGIFNSEHVKDVWEYKFKGEWIGANEIDYQHTWDEFKAQCDCRHFGTQRRLVAEAALCNTDSGPEVVEKNYYYMVGETKIWCLEKTYLQIIRYEKARGIEPTCTGFQIIPRQPNKPQNTDSLHVGETEQENISIQHLPHVQEAADNYYNIHWKQDNDYRPIDYEPVVEGYCQGYADGFQSAKQQLSEAGESKWIDVKDRLPTKAGEVLGIMAETLDQYICFYRPKKKLFQVYGAGVDPISDMKVTHWQPLPSAPNETNVSPKLYTHSELLAFGEKVKELTAERVTTYSDDMGVWVDKESILSIDLNKIEIK